MIKTSELWQRKDILKALIMSSVLGNFTKCPSAVLYTKNVCVCGGGNYSQNYCKSSKRDHSVLREVRRGEATVPSFAKPFHSIFSLILEMLTLIKETVSDPALCYSACERLFLRGFSFRSSLYSDTRPTPEHLAANIALEKKPLSPRVALRLTQLGNLHM